MTGERGEPAGQGVEAFGRLTRGAAFEQHGVGTVGDYRSGFGAPFGEELDAISAVSLVGLGDP